MKEFPVIDRVRESRRKISEECDHDTEKLVTHYQDMEKQTKRKFFRKEMNDDKAA